MALVKCIAKCQQTVGFFSGHDHGSGFCALRFMGDKTVKGYRGNWSYKVPGSETNGT